MPVPLPLSHQKMLKKYKVVIYIEKTIYANDKDECYEIFWHDIATTPQQLDEHTKIIEE